MPPQGVWQVPRSWRLWFSLPHWLLQYLLGMRVQSWRLSGDIKQNEQSPNLWLNFFVHQLTGPCTLVGCPDWPRQPCLKNRTGSLFLQYLLYRSSLFKKLILTFDVVHILHCRRFLLHGQALCERSLPSQPHQILLQGWRVPKGFNFSSFVSRRNKHFTVVFLFSVYLQRLPWHVEQLPLLVVV